MWNLWLYKGDNNFFSPLFCFSWIRDLGSGIEKKGSGINIPDLQANIANDLQLTLPIDSLIFALIQHAWHRTRKYRTVQWTGNRTPICEAQATKRYLVHIKQFYLHSMYTLFICSHTYCLLITVLAKYTCIYMVTLVRETQHSRHSFDVHTVFC